jgi:DNA polymerase epsilon subunit 1
MVRGNSRGTFGLVPGRGRRGSSSTHFRGGRGFRGRGGAFRGRGGAQSKSEQPALGRDDDAVKLEDRFEDIKTADEIDEKLGFARFSEGPPREGWLVNMHTVGGLRPFSVIS